MRCKMAGALLGISSGDRSNRGRRTNYSVRFFAGVPTQTPGLFGCACLHPEPGGQSSEVSQGCPATVFFDGVPTQTPGLFGSLCLQRKPEGQSLELSQGLPATVLDGVLTQTPELFGSFCSHRKPCGQSLEVSQGFPATSAGEPVGNDETTKAVNAARTTIRSGFFINCPP